MNDYYVYVYIDPRNYEEFYFGKGRGSRKHAHLSDSSDNKKVARIAAIVAARLTPIIRVIARNLTEHDALLVEKTLLWKLGRQLTNISSGHYAENFRPHDKLHTELAGFDYQNAIYYFNVGEGPHRHWDDYRQFGFISAGQGAIWRDAILGLQSGDVIAAYLKGHGFVGIGQIKDQAKPIREVTIDGKPLLSLPLVCPNMDANIESDDLSEYVCLIDWKKTFAREEAKWKSKAGIYTTPLVRASLENQPITIAFLELEFNLNFKELIA